MSHIGSMILGVAIAAVLVTVVKLILKSKKKADIEE